jgi:hypothetical protein
MAMGITPVRDQPQRRVLTPDSYIAIGGVEYATHGDVGRAVAQQQIHGFFLIGPGISDEQQAEIGRRWLQAAWCRTKAPGGGMSQRQ